MVRVIQEFLRLSPPRQDHLPALRIALGVAVPLLLLLATGRLDLSIYASFAAFTGIYARHEPLTSRVRHQVTSAVLLLACVALGVSLARAGTGPFGVTLAAALVSGVGAVLAAALGLRPAGSLFYVFTVTGVATLPNAAPLPLALGVACASAGFSVLLGVLGALYSQRVRQGELFTPPPSPLTEEDLSWHGGRHALAAGLGGVLGTLLLPGTPHTAWAMVAAVAPISAQDHQGRVLRAVHRVVGTLLGLLLTSLLLRLPLQPWGTALVIVALQFLAELFIARNYSVALLFVTPLALLMSQLAHPVPANGLLVARATETVLGALAGLLVVLLVRSRRER